MTNKNMISKVVAQRNNKTGEVDGYSVNILGEKGGRKYLDRIDFYLPENLPKEVVEYMNGCEEYLWGTAGDWDTVWWRG